MYGLIGKKLGHSFSANFFNKKFLNEGIDESYQLFPLDSVSEIQSLLKNNNNLKGLNVTIPYKQTIIPYLNDISEEAREIGAVNVIKIFQNSDSIILKGYNSDYKGFLESLKPLITPSMKKALILGTGGASKAVAYSLKKLGMMFKFVSRNPSADQFSYKDLNKEILSDYHIIINTTPLGMWPDIESFPPIPYHFLTPEHLCYDLVYNPLETSFMKMSAENGAKVKNGLEMLEKQALAAWEIWNT